MNRVELVGSLIERLAVRHTPAGVPVTECRIRHESEQIEAGSPRRVECEVPAVGLGEASKWLQAAQPGSQVKVTGFLAAKSRNSKQLILHIEHIEFLEGN
ncbi:MAG: primosomal replication protein N [Zoogloeaceae bacterium]|nr:primosomal replication protein N [Zoogloeaceae bacterium]